MADTKRQPCPPFFLMSAETSKILDTKTHEPEEVTLAQSASTAFPGMKQQNSITSSEAREQEVPSQKDVVALKTRMSSSRKRKNESLLADICEELEHE